MPYSVPHREWGPENYPACGVHFVVARNFCAWLSKQTGKKFRLPTEAEWEYACRAGEPAPEGKSLGDYAWFAEDSGDEPHPVGKKKPNAFGLYDMLGNVAEYVVRDPKDEKGLVAGGHYRSERKDVGSGAREAYDPKWLRSNPQVPKSKSWLSDAYYVGFRVVMEE
jgi:formylglycine-generating enzyme required for sulfatase activity